MKFNKVFLLLPCQTLEGYALERQAGHADALLAAWSALYHPALLAAVEALPRWATAQDPPKDPASSLIVVPPACDEIVGADWVEQAAASDSRLIRGPHPRQALVEAALGQLDDAPVDVAPDLAADFFALGYGHLQIEVLTRDAGYQMGGDVNYYDEQYYGYGYQFDRDLFERDAVAAAAAACQGDREKADEHLQSALVRLTDARRNLPYTYSTDVDPHLLDLTLVAPTTIGQALRDELSKPVPTNLLVAGEVVELIARREPQTLAVLKASLEQGKTVLIGGGFSELPLPLLTPEAILDDLQRGLEAYRRCLGVVPTIYGRRRMGLWPVLPQVLRKLGFAGAVHFTLDDGRFPTSSKPKIWWVGIDGTELEALAQLPADAAKPATFLNFAGKISNTSYHEANATAVLAHWPGQVCPWYRDIQRLAVRSPVLGEFRTLTEYLEQSQSISQWARSGPDEYRSPFLKEAVAHAEIDPITRWVDDYRRQAAADAVDALDVLADLVGGETARSSRDDWRRAIAAARQAKDAPSAPSLDARLKTRLGEATDRVVRLLASTDAARPSGCLVVNPWSFPQNALIDVSPLERVPDVGGPVRAAGESSGRKQAVVEVPALGFAWVGPGQGASPAPPKSRWWKRKKSEEPPLAEGNVVRNDHFEATIHPITGAIQSIGDYVTRGNRLAQQIAFRQPDVSRSRDDDDVETDYSIMAADQIAVTSPGPVVGEIVVRGRLMGRDGNRLARFTQTCRSRRGSPVLELQIDLDIDRQPGANPWDSYYAARFAWGDAAADLYRSVSLTNRPTERELIEAPHFVDVVSGEKRITILCGGLPYHRRFGLRKLDTLLVVRGETARTFRLGIGVNLTHPLPAAMAFLAPDPLVSPASPPRSGRSGWLFHVDARNVVATRWEPRWSEGSASGFRVRLLETEGRAGRVGLRSFRKLAAARKVDFRGERPSDLPVEGDKITVSLGAHEWVQIEADFAR